MVSYYSLEGEQQKEGLECRDVCKSLDRADYESLLWTTFAEFPGKVQHNYQ